MWVCSSPLCRVVQVYSYRIYFAIVEYSYKFLQILKICPIFWELNQLKNDLKSPHSAGPKSARGYRARLAGTTGRAPSNKSGGGLTEVVARWRGGEAARCGGARRGPHRREGQRRLRLAPGATGRTREVRAAPNREISTDWWVSPWRGKTATTTVGNTPRRATVARSPTQTWGRLDWPWVKESEGEKKGGERGSIRQLSFERRRGEAGEGWGSAQCHMGVGEGVEWGGCGATWVGTAWARWLWAARIAAGGARRAGTVGALRRGEAAGAAADGWDRGQWRLVSSGCVREAEAARTHRPRSTVPPDSVFKLIQTESNLFQTDSKLSKFWLIQKVSSLAQKIGNKIWFERAWHKEQFFLKNFPQIQNGIWTKNQRRFYELNFNRNLLEILRT
jgi:hypothetical protein